MWFEVEVADSTSVIYNEAAKCPLPLHSRWRVAIWCPEYQKLSLSAPILPMKFIYMAMEKGLFLKDIQHKCPAIVMVIGDKV